MEPSLSLLRLFFSLRFCSACFEMPSRSRQSVPKPRAVAPQRHRPERRVVPARAPESAEDCGPGFRAGQSRADAGRAASSGHTELLRAADPLDAEMLAAMLLAASPDPVEEFTAVLATDVVPVPWRRSNAPRRWRCCWPSARCYRSRRAASRLPNGSTPWRDRSRQPGESHDGCGCCAPVRVGEVRRTQHDRVRVMSAKPKARSSTGA